MSERECQGEGCDILLIDAFEKPPNGYGYWCANCLSQKMVAGYKYICHYCGIFFKEEIEVASHWYDEHAADDVP